MSEVPLFYYLVRGKSDDYGACLIELVQTTPEKAAEYYSHEEVPPEDVAVLEKYFDLIDYEEESKRSSDKRYYGGSD